MMIPEPTPEDLERLAEVEYFQRPIATAWIRRAVAAERDNVALLARLEWFEAAQESKDDAIAAATKRAEEAEADIEPKLQTMSAVRNGWMRKGWEEAREAALDKIITSLTAEQAANRVRAMQYPEPTEARKP